MDTEEDEESAKNERQKQMTTARRCGTCSHWAKHTQQCWAIEADDRKNMQIEPNLGSANIDVIVSDDYGLMVRFQTGENFGCVLWRSRENQ